MDPMTAVLLLTVALTVAKFLIEHGPEIMAAIQPLLG